MRPSIHPVYRALGVGLLAGLLVGLLAAPAVGVGDSPSPDFDDPGYSFWRASSCYDGPREHGGWVHTVAFGQGYPTTLNATVVHAPDKTVAANVTRRADGRYELALRTVPDDDVERCDGSAASEVGLATTLEHPAFVVTLDGRTVRSVDQTETTANLYPLPKPLNATTDG